MPELPEVETTRLGILSHISGQQVTKVVVRQAQLRWPVPKNFARQLVGKTITAVERRGKYLLLRTQSGTCLIHLGMSGSLRILSQTMPAQKHDHVDIYFANNKLLRFTDPRRFGAILWTSSVPEQHALLKKLGVEPLTKAFSANYLWQSARNRKVNIKQFMMNAHIVVGVGNIYANEALFAAGIHPQRCAASLSATECQTLVRSIKKILRAAIKQGGTTLKDFQSSEGKPGYFKQQLKVYGRAGFACLVCDSVLQEIRIGQRSTVCCDVCQI